MNTRRYHIETLLICAATDLIESKEEGLIGSVSSAVELLIQDEEIFQELPKTVFVTNETLAEIEEAAGSSVGLMKDRVTKGGELTPSTEEYFETPAVLLYDGLKASGFGKMSYIYRAKGGTRIYVNKNGKILTISPYCTIDHQGFYLCNEVIDEIFAFDSDYDDIKLPFSFVEFAKQISGERVLTCVEIIKMLCNIRKPFKKDFFLEYLLLPPDVDKLSLFSENLRRELWDVCLSKEFEQEWSVEMQSACMNALSVAKVPPFTNQIVIYVKEAVNIRGSTANAIMDRLNQLETNIINEISSSTAKDIIDIKPGIWGVSVDIKEVFKQLKSKAK